MRGVAGSLESSDVMVVVEESSENGISIELDGVDKARFRTDITSIAKGIAQRKGVNGIKITINDRGAINATIAARVETAIERYLEQRGVRS